MRVIPERFTLNGKLYHGQPVYVAKLSRSGVLSEDDVVRSRYIENGVMWLTGAYSDEFDFLSLYVDSNNDLWLEVSPKLSDS